MYINIESLPEFYQNLFIKIPINMIDLSLKYNSTLTLVYLYLMMNRNMLGKTNITVSDMQKDIFKASNSNAIKKRTDDILNSYYLLSNCITKENNDVVLNDLISIEKYNSCFDDGEINYETLNDSLKIFKEKIQVKDIKNSRFSIIVKESENLAFTKFFTKEYLGIMNFTYNAKSSNKETYKVFELINLYLLIKRYIAINTVYSQKFFKNDNISYIPVDKLVKINIFSRVTLNKYLNGLCECGLIEKYKKDIKVYYKLTHKEFI